MRVIGTLAVRNGADIVEAVVRHNLTVLDALVVLVQGTSDRTAAILAELASEGLAVAILAEADPLATRRAVDSRLAREAFADPAADWVIGLEFGDFLKPASRTTLHAALAAADPRRPLALPVHTYVPDFAHGADPLARLAGAKRLAVEPRPLVRHAVPRTCATDDGVATVAAAAPATIAVARLPVRSVEQLVADCLTIHLANLAGGSAPSPAAWADAVYAEIRAGRKVTAALAEAAAVNAGAPRSEWVAAVGARRVDDPFLAAIALTRTAATPPYALGQVMALGEHLAWNEARRVQSQLRRDAEAGAALARSGTVKEPPR